MSILKNLTDAVKFELRPDQTRAIIKLECAFEAAKWEPSLASIPKLINQAFDPILIAEAPGFKAKLIAMRNDLIQEDGGLSKDTFNALCGNSDLGQILSEWWDDYRPRLTEVGFQNVEVWSSNLGVEPVTAGDFRKILELIQTSPFKFVKMELLDS